jgi:hypothetical protein
VYSSSAKRAPEAYSTCNGSKRGTSVQGLYVDSHLPPDALVVTSWESGSIRYTVHRNTMVWDALGSTWLDRAIAYVRMRGYEPYLLFERWEEPAPSVSDSPAARLRSSIGRRRRKSPGRCASIGLTTGNGT